MSIFFSERKTLGLLEKKFTNISDTTASFVLLTGDVGLVLATAIKNIKSPFLRGKSFKWEGFSHASWVEVSVKKIAQSL